MFSGNVDHPALLRRICHFGAVTQCQEFTTAFPSLEKILYFVIIDFVQAYGTLIVPHAITPYEIMPRYFRLPVCRATLILGRQVGEAWLVGRRCLDSERICSHGIRSVATWRSGKTKSARTLWNGRLRCRRWLILGTNNCPYIIKFAETGCSSSFNKARQLTIKTTVDSPNYFCLQTPAIASKFLTYCSIYQSTLSYL